MVENVLSSQPFILRMDIGLLFYKKSEHTPGGVLQANICIVLIGVKYTDKIVTHF